MTTRADDHIGESGSPTNLGDFERYPLLFGPSPVHRLERLTSHLGGATLWAKRDQPFIRRGPMHEGRQGDGRWPRFVREARP
ncbi:hypothetical protein BH18ACT11_BH18ACT11_30410 [soil metagenome]